MILVQNWQNMFLDFMVSGMNIFLGSEISVLVRFLCSAAAGAAAYTAGASAYMRENKANSS